MSNDKIKALVPGDKWGTAEEVELEPFSIEIEYEAVELTATEKARRRGFDFSQVRDNRAELDVVTGKRIIEE